MNCRFNTNQTIEKNYLFSCTLKANHYTEVKEFELIKVEK